MSRWIHLSNGHGRNARVRMEPPRLAPRELSRTADGRVVTAERFIKSHAQSPIAALLKGASPSVLAQALLEGDPEIDLEATGRRVGPTDRVFLDADGALLHATSRIEVRYDSQGRETERREPIVTLANVDTQASLLLGQKRYPRAEVVRRFAFTRQYRLRHVDGLTFDFLLAMATELADTDALARIGAGPSGKDPLILERNGLPYRGFLEGRVAGETYLLVLHLTHLELKSREIELR